MEYLRSAGLMMDKGGRDMDFGKGTEKETEKETGKEIGKEIREKKFHSRQNQPIPKYIQGTNYRRHHKKKYYYY